MSAGPPGSPRRRRGPRRAASRGARRTPSPDRRRRPPGPPPRASSPRASPADSRSRCRCWCRRCSSVPPWVDGARPEGDEAGLAHRPTGTGARCAPCWSRGTANVVPIRRALWSLDAHGAPRPRAPSRSTNGPGACPRGSRPTPSGVSPQSSSCSTTSCICSARDSPDGSLPEGVWPVSSACVPSSEFSTASSIVSPPRRGSGSCRVLGRTVVFSRHGRSLAPPAGPRLTPVDRWHAQPGRPSECIGGRWVQHSHETRVHVDVGAVRTPRAGRARGRRRSGRGSTSR